MPVKRDKVVNFGTGVLVRAPGGRLAFLHRGYGLFRRGHAVRRGYISPYFITNAEKMMAELENPYILIYEKKLSNMQSPVVSSSPRI